MQFDETQIDMGGFITARLQQNNALKNAQNVKDYEELNKKLKTPALHKGGAPKV
jgi:hypothetical protein